MFFGRGKNKDVNIIATKELYNSYICTVENSTYNIPQVTYTNIQRDFYKYVSSEILNGKDYKMPAGFGTICIRKKRPGGHSLRISWADTNNSGKLVFNFNEHSNGWRYKFKWFKLITHIANVKYYMFKPCRTIARELASNIKNNKTDYYEIN
jgi:hypothetical protein